MTLSKEGGSAPLFFLYHKRIPAGFLVFLTCFAIDLLALCPTAYVGDSSLFSAASFMLGTAHPPGYPLTIMLGKLFTLLPFGNIAYKTNLLGAVSGALASTLVFHASTELGGSRSASWAAALICSLSPVFFTESLKAEAYTLNSLIVMVVFILGYKIIKGGNFFRLSLLAVFTVGIGLGNHQTIVVAGLALLVPFALRWRELSFRWLILAMLFFLAGFSVYLLLYLRSLTLDRPVESLIYSYAGSLVDFIKVFLREDFGGSEKAVEALSGHVLPWIYALKNSLYYIVYPSLRPVIIFPVLGLAALAYRKLWGVLIYFLFFLFIWLFVLGRMVISSPSPSVDNIQTVSVYFLPVVPVLYCLVALGFTFTMDFFRKMQWNALSRFAPYILVVLPFVFLPYSLRDYRLDRTYIAYDSGRDMIQGLPIKSLIINYTDNATFTTYYLRAAERFREDLIEMSTGGNNNTFGLQTSPPWKYEALFPEFYHGRNSTLKEMNAMFAYNGRLFVNNPLDRSKVFVKKYAYYPSFLSAMLIPKSLGKNRHELMSEANRDFMGALERSNYERTIDTPYPSDFMTRELFAQYGFGLAVYSELVKQQGEPGKAEHFMALSLKAAEPQLFAWPYITFLLEQKRKEDAFTFITRLKTMNENRNLVTLLENMTQSSIKEMHAKKSIH